MAEDLPAQFLRWLDVIPGRGWLVAGCAGGGLTEAILRTMRPTAVTTVDPSRADLDLVARDIGDPRARFEVDDLRFLPFETGTFDVAVSGLALDFPQPEQIVVEMRRTLWPSGTVGIYARSSDAQSAERLLRGAGLRAVQSHLFDPGAGPVLFLRGTR